MISIEPITPDLGADVRGVFETGAPREEIATILRRALLAHHLLVVRAHTLTPPELIALGSMFGELVRFADAKMPEYPEIFRTSNHRDQGFLNVGQHWHVDGTMTQGGTPISVWHVIEHPTEGGDTLYANMHRAYEELPEDLRARVDNLRMVARSGAKHALVKRHPATQRKALYTNVRLTENFIGMDRQQTKALLNRLDEHLDRPGGHYRHKWQVGDVVIGDNFSVAHKAIPTDPRFTRILHRVTIRGGTAFFRPAAQNQKAHAVHSDV